LPERASVLLAAVRFVMISKRGEDVIGRYQLCKMVSSGLEALH
jgi:hypothetical protein